jgi:dipeptide transport system substrate-binding protein
MKPLLFSLAILAASHAQAEKTLVYCSEASPSAFNAQLGEDSATFNATTAMIYNRLVELSSKGQPAPALAEKWTISKDGLTYTFHLRQGVQFHTTPGFKPTRPLTSDDVVFSFERALDPKHPFHSVSGGIYPYFTNLDLDHLIKKIEKVDDQTLRFHLTRPDASFLSTLAMAFGVVLSAEYGQELLQAHTLEKMDVEPIGTGPFVFKRYVKDQRILFDAHPKYWAGRAKVDKAVFEITPDASIRLQKLKTGECQLATQLPAQDLENLKSDARVKVVSRVGANVGYLAFNMEKPPFDKLEVREAIAHALNREYYLKAIYQNRAILAHGPIPPTIWGANPKVTDYEYNPDKAKALLKKAGFPNGFQTELWTLPVTRPYNPNGKKMGELMQADLKKVGIHVKLVTFDWSTYLDIVRKGEHQLLQMGALADSSDPDSFTGALLSCAAVKGGWNVARWCDPELDKLMLKAKSLSDVRERTVLYYEIQNRFRAKIPWVTLAHGTVFRGLAKNVVGYEMGALDLENIYSIGLK